MSQKYKINDNREYYRTIYLKSNHWKELKAKKFASDPNPICNDCNNSHNLDAHHLRYKNLYDVELTDLIFLCRSCHSNEHKKQDLVKQAKLDKKRKKFKIRIGKEAKAIPSNVKIRKVVFWDMHRHNSAYKRSTIG